MIATIPSEATRGARAVRDGPKYLEGRGLRYKEAKLSKLNTVARFRRMLGEI